MKIAIKAVAAALLTVGVLGAIAAGLVTHVDGLNPVGPVTSDQPIRPAEECYLDYECTGDGLENEGPAEPIVESTPEPQQRETDDRIEDLERKLKEQEQAREDRAAYEDGISRCYENTSEARPSLSDFATTQYCEHLYSDHPGAP